MVYNKKDEYFVLFKPINPKKKTQSPIGEKVFHNYDSSLFIFKINTCHLIANALIAPLMLPYWLENGLIIFCSDKILDNKSVKNESLTFLKNEDYGEMSQYSFLNTNRGEFVYNYVKGYWTVRYLEEEYPGFLKETFKTYKGEDVVRMIVEKLGLDTTDDEKMWIQLDELLYNHYKHLLETE